MVITVDMSNSMSLTGPRGNSSFYSGSVLPPEANMALQKQTAALTMK